MKIKTSPTLSEDLVESIDRMAGTATSRSSFIENILRDYVEGRAQAQRDARELARINKHAAKLNAEMEDILSLQANLADE